MLRRSPFFACLVVVLVAACGGSTDGDGSGSSGAGGSGGSGGSGAASGSGGSGGGAGCAAIAPCCDAQGNEVPTDCSSGIPLCPPGSSVPPSGICQPSGCSPSAPCSASEYCDYPDDLCGSGATGECKPRPRGCDLSYAPVCGCDGQVHPNACAGHSTGADISAIGGCEAPSGSFACGQMFCSVGQQYCKWIVSDVGGVPSSYECHPLPLGCGPTATCACLANEPCGSFCELHAPGEITVTCPGG